MALKGRRRYGPAALNSTVALDLGTVSTLAEWVGNRAGAMRWDIAHAHAPRWGACREGAASNARRKPPEKGGGGALSVPLSI